MPCPSPSRRTTSPKPRRFHAAAFFLLHSSMCNGTMTFHHRKPGLRWPRGEQMARSAFRSALTAFALTVAAAVPALAGDVLIPLAANQQTTGNLTYSTKVWVSNPTASSLAFTTRFYPAGTDGTKAAPASSAVVVAPGTTVVLTGVAPAGSSGMLSLTGAPQLSAGARLESFLGGQSVGLSDVP